MFPLNCKTAFSLHVVESASDDYSFYLILLCVAFFVEGFSTEMPPFSISIPSPTFKPSCPNPADYLYVYNYFNRRRFTLIYPTDISSALQGSGGQMRMPSRPYKIEFHTETSNVHLKYSVRNAKSITTTFTYISGKTETTRLISEVSLSQVLLI